MSILMSIFLFVVGLGIVRGLFKIAQKLFNAVIDMSTTIAIVVLLAGAIAFYPQWRDALLGEDFNLATASVDFLEDLALRIQDMESDFLKEIITEPAIDSLVSIPDFFDPPSISFSSEKQTVPQSYHSEESDTTKPEQRTVIEYVRHLPERSYSDSNDVSVTNESIGEEIDCNTPFPENSWIIAESFFGEWSNAYRRVQDLTDAGFLNVNYFDTACYATDAGSSNSKGSPRLYVVTLGPPWDNEVEVDQFGVDVATAVESMDFKLKTIRPIYLKEK